MSDRDSKLSLGRRDVLAMGLGLTAAAALPSCAASRPTPPPASSGSAIAAPRLGRRRLGSLEVSSVGLGVQNMSRNYEATVPYRPEMIQVIRAAFDRGVTFYDAAEAYGPHEVERILGEAVAPFRDQVVIATKFGWNIDQETGERRPGTNSKPEHIERVVDGMLQRLRTDRIDLLYQHRVDAEVPIEDGAGAVAELMAQGNGASLGRSRDADPRPCGSEAGSWPRSSTKDTLQVQLAGPAES